MSEKHEQFDAVIVGSGFGGSINALRLAQAGKSVVVLERGKRYTPGTFPRDVRDVDNLLWRYPVRPQSQGLYDVRFFSGVGAVVASGVGEGAIYFVFEFQECGHQDFGNETPAELAEVTGRARAHPRP